MRAGTGRPAVRSDAYWTVLQEIADGLAGTGRNPPGHTNSASTAALHRLLNIGYGPRAVLDLSALVALVVIRAWPDHSRDDHGKPDLAALLKSAAATSVPLTSATPTAISSGPFTVIERPTRQHAQRAHELQLAVVEALQVDPDHPIARSTARRALAAYGQGVREVIAIYGTICALVAHLGPAAQEVEQEGTGEPALLRVICEPAEASPLVLAEEVDEHRRADGDFARRFHR